jgi:hypothetical protein
VCLSPFFFKEGVGDDFRLKRRVRVDLGNGREEFLPREAVIPDLSGQRELLAFHYSRHEFEFAPTICEN